MATTPRQNFSASYFDGKSARKFDADVTVSPRGLVVSVSGAESRLWLYDSLRAAQADPGQPLHLEHHPAGGDEHCPEILVVDHTDFPRVLHEAEPSVLKLPPRSALVRMARLLALSALSLLLLTFCIKYAAPVLVDGVVNIFPHSWEKKLGGQILDELRPRNYQPPSPETQKTLGIIVDRLLTGISSPVRHPFHVHVFPQKIVNALALPGGNIIVFQGLLNKTDTPEELAGVLAHEMQHVILRHATRNIVREAGVKLFFFLMGGEISNKALQVAEGLAYLSYSREMEADADREGMKTIIASGTDPEGMVRIFEKLAAEENKKTPDLNSDSNHETKAEETPLWLKYLSTHPASKNRVEEFKQLAGTRDTSTPIKPLLPGMDWTAMHVHKQAHF